MSKATLDINKSYTTSHWMLNVARKWSASGFLWQKPSVSEQPRSRQSLAMSRQPQPPNPTRRDMQINVVFMLGTGAAIECCTAAAAAGQRARRDRRRSEATPARTPQQATCVIRNPNAFGPSFLQRRRLGFYTSSPAPQCAIHRRRRRNHHHHHRAFAGAAARGAAERHPPPWSQPQRQQRRRC